MSNEIVPASWMTGAVGTLEEAQPIAEMLARSALVPKAYHGKPSDIIVACAMGRSVGLSPLQALAGIAVVNGKPCLYGDAMLAVCQSRADWGGMSVEWPSENHCRVMVYRVLRTGEKTSGAGEFTDADAKKAGLWSKSGPWSQYPHRMLEIRARAFALRNVFADALMGFSCKEEVEDYREVDATVVAQDQPVRRGRKPRVVTQQVSAPAHIVDAAAESVVMPSDGENPQPPTAPSAEEIVDNEALAELKKTMNSAAKHFGRDRVVAAAQAVCGHEISTADDVDVEKRMDVVAALCALQEG